MERDRALLESQGSKIESLRSDFTAGIQSHEEAIREVERRLLAEDQVTLLDPRFALHPPFGQVLDFFFFFFCVLCPVAHFCGDCILATMPFGPVIGLCVCLEAGFACFVREGNVSEVGCVAWIPVLRRPPRRSSAKH